MKLRVLLLGILSASLLAAAAAAAAMASPAKNPPTLQVSATYDTGLGANGAEIISVRSHDGLAVLTNVAGSVDVLDLSEPKTPALRRRVATTGTPNSAAIHPHHDYFLVVTGGAGQQGTVAAYRLSDGALLGSAQVGTQPDSIAIAPNGRYAVVANESITALRRSSRRPSRSATTAGMPMSRSRRTAGSCVSRCAPVS